MSIVMKNPFCKDYVDTSGVYRLPMVRDSTPGYASKSINAKAGATIRRYHFNRTAEIRKLSVVNYDKF